MPYINIREQDINPIAGFDTLNNAVLIFGFDFHRYDYPETTINELVYTSGPKSGEKIYGNKAYKVYTSLQEFLRDTSAFKKYFTQRSAFTNDLVLRPYLTAYDCLLQGLPVIYVPIDDYITGNEGASLIITGTTVETHEAKSYIEYLWLSDYNAVPPMDGEYWSSNELKVTFTSDQIADIVDNICKEDNVKNAAERALYSLVSDENFSRILPLSDRINMPITFITTCGYEGLDEGINTYRAYIINAASPNNSSDVLYNEAAVSRLDFLYLYDFRPELSPDYISTNAEIIDVESGLSFTKPELVNIVYPWGHYNLYSGLNSTAHMPGSYGYLMAYANSIKNNMPWLAAAGINRGRIPNITALDYDIKESYLHLWQGDEISGSGVWNSKIRINPIIDLGINYGKVVFGNRTCFTTTESNATVFREFLNIRLLLIYIHKQLFRVSMTHMFEPNDDIVWLSFKQAANSLLDKMVTGRGIKWYKWQRLRPEDRNGNLILGQIKAKLTIRPLEAVESFDITIHMTDQDIEFEITEGEE